MLWITLVACSQAHLVISIFPEETACFFFSFFLHACGDLNRIILRIRRDLGCSRLFLGAPTTPRKRLMKPSKALWWRWSYPWNGWQISVSGKENMIVLPCSAGRDQMVRCCSTWKWNIRNVWRGSDSYDSLKGAVQLVLGLLRPWSRMEPSSWPTVRSQRHCQEIWTLNKNKLMLVMWNHWEINMYFFNLCV